MESAQSVDHLFPSGLDPSTRFILPDESPLLANLAALWAADPALAAALESFLDRDPYPVEPSKAGPPTLALSTSDNRRLYLHSRYQPVDEARKLIDAAELEGKAVFAVHGLGLGYHVEELLARINDPSLVLVLEPDLHLLRTAFGLRDFSKAIGARRLLFITAVERSTLMQRLQGQAALISVGLSFITHNPSMQLHPEFHRELQTHLTEFVAYCRTSLNTLVLNGRTTCENIAGNLGWYVTSPGINALKNRHARQPAIIVSAGPSLRKNKHLLPRAAGHAVMIAVQTTLQPLLELGIEPDYVTSLDYHDISTRFFERLPPTLRCELVAEAKASSRIFSLYPGPLRLLGNDFADRLLREMPQSKERLRAGATVAHLAFYLAEQMGCDPIIFVGQDLGFSDGLCYTPGTSYEDVWRPELGRFCTMEMKQWEHIARDRPILRKVPDQQGRAMYTEERLFSYLQQFERDFATSRARIIDATEGGALKRGAEVLTLADALEKYCAPSDGDRGIEGQRDKEALPHPSSLGPLVPTSLAPIAAMPATDTALPAALSSLRLRLDEAQRIHQIGLETLPLLQEVKENLEDQPRVNRLIARIDALRSRMTELNDAYELIIQLTQQTELQRYHADRKIAASGATGLERQRLQLDRDMLNVQGVITAAAEFQRLMENAMGRIEAFTPGRP